MTSDKMDATELSNTSLDYNVILITGVQSKMDLKSMKF